MRVAELITNWRFIKKYSLRDAAEEMGLSASSLLRIEKGKVPDGETLIKLINWLFGENHDRQESVLQSGVSSGAQGESQDVSAHSSADE